MKINDQDIPPELREIYDQLVTDQESNDDGQTIIRQSHRSRRTRAAPKREPLDNGVKAALIYIANRMDLKRGTPEYQDFIGGQTNKINQGQWDTTYWKKAKKLEIKYFSESPESTPDPGPPPYAYRDSENLPSIPEYISGEESSGPARYQGQTIAGYFKDVTLVWARIIYSIKHRKTKGNYEPALLSWNTSITINTDQRASRPMLSLVMRSYMTDESSDSLNTTANPVIEIPPSAPAAERGCNSMYWRYEIPGSGPPFFSDVQLRSIVKNMQSISTIEVAVNQTRAVICAAPRPMFGRGFNNCQSVSTSIDTLPEIYQVTEPWEVNIGLGYGVDQGTFNTMWLENNIKIKNHYESEDGDFYTETHTTTTQAGSSHTWTSTAILQTPFLELTIVTVEGIDTVSEGTTGPTGRVHRKGKLLGQALAWNKDTKKYSWSEHYFDWDDITFNIDGDFADISPTRPMQGIEKVFEMEIGKGRRMIRSGPVTIQPYAFQEIARFVGVY